jgi:hypothetical protein
MRLKLNEQDIIRGFRTYLAENKFPEELLVLKYALSTIPISSSECERVFSQMNFIVTLQQLLYQQKLFQIFYL